ncbi:MAG: hypothetical protein IJ314_00340 [Bacteroidales bacterium]|nr:hypothetical protein [Bacteroidales bacterium]
MHKLHKFFILASVLIFASCINEMESGQTDTDGADEGSFVLEVSIDDPTRTALGSSDASVYHTVWNEGDMISVNGIMSYPVPAESAGKSKAAFSFDGFPMLPLNLLYPATEETAFVEFPITQTYVKDSFDPRAAVMYATSAGFENVSLSHLSSLLRFSFTSAENVAVKCILVKSDSKEPLAGSFTMKTDEKGGFTGGISAAAGAPSMVVLDCGDGVALSQTATAFYVAVPYGTYSGFSIQVITTDGNIMALNYTPSNAGVLNPSKVVVFPDKEFVSDGVAKLIGNEADLLSFAESAADYSTVILMDDIEITSEDFSPIKDFVGTFEGGDNTISGLKTPLFDNLLGNVSNLHVQGDVVETTETNVGLLARTGNGGDIIGCSASGSVAFVGTSDLEQVTVGGLVGEVSLGTVSSCRSDVEMTMSEMTAKNLYVGGVLGTSRALLSNLENSGAIMVGADVTVSNVLIAGGVAGRVYDAAAGITNKGTVVVNASTALLYASSVFGATVLSDKNFSNLSTTADASLEIALQSSAKRIDCFVGGLIGYHNVSNSVVSDSENNARVSVAVPAETQMKLYAAGGIGYSYYELNDSDISVSLSGILNNGTVSVDGASLVFEDSKKDFAARSLIGGIIGKAYIKGTNAKGEYKILNSLNSGVLSLKNSGSKRVYIGGIAGEAMTSDFIMNNCTNSGDITAEGTYEYIALAGHLGVVWREAMTSVKINGATNTGSLTLSDGDASSYSYAGGVVAMANGTGTKTKLSLDVVDCSNSGRIYRYVSGATNKKQSYAGGIVGAIGLNNNAINNAVDGKTITADCVEAAVVNCSNSGEIIFNQYTGQKEFKEKSITYSFTGGILGLSKAVSGFIQVKNCSNTGSILSTSGQHGGIVGFAHSSTAIYGEGQYCTNEGIVGLPQNHRTVIGSAYLVVGGICGYMNDKGNNSRIEYCWNSGSVTGSSNQKKDEKMIGAGGIVGQLRLPDIVRYCKNNAHVRSASSAEQKIIIAGIISGSDSSFPVKYCAVGGSIGKGGGDPVEMQSAGEKPFNNFIYNESVSLETAIESGIEFWDGTSKTSWEK